MSYSDLFILDFGYTQKFTREPDMQIIFIYKLYYTELTVSIIDIVPHS